MKSYPKGSQEFVGRHFKATDFDCPCKQSSCTETKLEDALVEKLDRLRDELGVPLYVDRGGGFRCQWYEDDLRRRGFETAQGVSQHELGRAADVNSLGKHNGMRLEQAARFAGFQAVGIGKFWIHVDLRDDRVRRWMYFAR